MKNIEIDNNVLFLLDQEENSQSANTTKSAKDDFLTLLDQQRTSFGKILFEPIPIKLTDITAFNYRVENCVN